MTRDKILLIIAVLMWTLASPSFALAANRPDQPTREEIITEVSRVTGLASDLTQAVLDSEPKLLENLGKAVFMVKVADNLLAARDTEAMAEIFDFQVGRVFDFFSTRAIHPGLLNFMGAVKIYKTSLKIVRDYLVIPKLDQGIYNRYKAARRSKTASPGEAFDQAIYAYLSGYHMIKDQWYQKLMKSKGYNPKLVGRRLEQSLRKKVDRFWIRRLEASFLQEWISPSGRVMKNSIWIAMKPELDRLMTLAGGRASFHAGLFLKPSDLPEGWWVPQGYFTKSSVQPHKVKNPDPKAQIQWNQTLPLSDAEGYEIHEKSGRYCRKNGGKGPVYDLPSCWVFINILERHINHEGQRFDWGRETIKHHVKRGSRYIGNKKAACMNRDNGNVHLFFIRGGYYVHLCLCEFRQGVHRYEPDFPKHEKLIKYLARKIAARLPGSEIGK